MTGLWDKLLSSALIGTVNRPLIIKADDTSLGDLLKRIQYEDEEQGLLAIAATIHLHNKAGQRVAHTFEGKLPHECVEDKYPISNLESTKYLEMILNGQVKSRLFNDWLNAAANAQVRVPHIFLIRFLDFAHKSCENGNLHPDISKIVGERGRWLAQYRKKWTFIHWENDFVWAWSRLGARTRRTIFRQMRMTNPRFAREFFIEKKSRLKDCSNYIDWMFLGQSIEDEPLFESLLDDENKSICQSAADRLKRMSESRYIARMVERMQERLTIGEDENGNPKLLLHLPTELDASMKRDTINRQPPRDMNDEKGWFFFMLTCVPPQHWCDCLKKTPEDLITLGSNQKDMFIEAWVRAANYHNDEKWARALIAYLMGSDEQHMLSWLIKLLPLEEQESIALEVWKRSHNGVYINSMIAGSNWSRNLSNEVIKLYHSALEENLDEALRWMRQALINQVYLLHPDTEPALRQLFTPHQENVKADTYQIITEALDILKIRQQIRLSFEISN